MTTDTPTRPIRPKTPCCNKTVKLTGLEQLGDSVRRTCGTCGARYKVTWVPALMEGQTKLHFEKMKDGVFTTTDQVGFGVKAPARRRRR